MSANLLSIGAIDFGIIVDGSVVMVEGMFVYLAHQQHKLGVQRFNLISKMSMIKRISVEMGKPIFFSKLIIITALLPIFAFQKVEGKMFSPLAYTIGFALLGALIFTLTLVPVLGHLLLNKNVREKSNPLVSFLENIYRPGLEWCIKKKKTALLISGSLLLVSLIIGSNLGTEFLPQLNELVEDTFTEPQVLSRPQIFTPEMCDDVGEHNGAHYYTVGQRRGLGIGGQAIPLFVVAIDVEKNLVYSAQGETHPALARRGLQPRRQSLQRDHGAWGHGAVRKPFCISRQAISPQGSILRK
jgi:hypothetical protein